MDISKLSVAILAAILILFFLICCGCYSSPTQCKATFALVYIDRRTLPQESAPGSPVRASDGGGYGNNGRAFVEQGMVLYASPMEAVSNSTPVSVKIPIIK